MNLLPFTISCLPHLRKVDGNEVRVGQIVSVGVLTISPGRRVWNDCLGGRMVEACSTPTQVSRFCCHILEVAVS